MDHNNETRLRSSHRHLARSTAPSSSHRQRRQQTSSELVDDHSITVPVRWRSASQDSEVSPRTVPPPHPQPALQLGHDHDDGWPRNRPGELPLLWDPSGDGHTARRHSMLFDGRRQRDSDARMPQAVSGRLRTESEERNALTRQGRRNVGRQGRRNAAALERAHRQHRASNARSQEAGERASEQEEEVMALVELLMSTFRPNMPTDVANRMRAILTDMRWHLDDDALEQVLADTADEIWSERRRTDLNGVVEPLNDEWRRIVEILERRWEELRNRREESRSEVAVEALIGSSETLDYHFGNDDQSLTQTSQSSAPAGGRPDADGTSDVGDFVAEQSQRRARYVPHVQILDHAHIGENPHSDHLARGRALRGEAVNVIAQIEGDADLRRALNEEARTAAEPTGSPQIDLTVRQPARAISGAGRDLNQLVAELTSEFQDIQRALAIDPTVPPRPLTAERQSALEDIIHSGMVEEEVEVLVRQFRQDADEIRRIQQLLSGGQRELREPQREPRSRQVRRERQPQRGMSSRRRQTARRRDLTDRSPSSEWTNLVVEMSDDDEETPPRPRRRGTGRRDPANLRNFTFNPSTDSLIDLDSPGSPLRRGSRRQSSRRRGSRCTYRDPTQELRDEEEAEDQAEILGLDYLGRLQLSEAGIARLQAEGVWRRSWEGSEIFGDESMFGRARGDFWRAGQGL